VSPIATAGAVGLPDDAGHIPGRSGAELTSQMAYLTRVIKAPTIARIWAELATIARADGWSHEEYLAAVLARQVADREANGTTIRTAGAHFPAVKTLEDFNVDHQPSLRRDVLAHLATVTFIPTAGNVVLLGPPGGRQDPPGDRPRHPRRPGRAPGPLRHCHRLDHPAPPRP
jgi:hypothetical protein